MLNGQTFFVEGRGGRGKSAILRILAGRELYRRQQGRQARVPLLIDAAQVRGSVFETLAAEVRTRIVALGTADAIERWMRQVEVLVGIDNWDRASPEAVIAIEQFIAGLGSTFIACVVTSRTGMRPPQHLAGSFVLEALTDSEQREFLSLFMGLNNSPEGWGDWLRRDAPFGLSQLLKEPVILQQYARLIARTYTGGFSLPANLPRLLDGALEASLATRSAQTRSRLMLVASVCMPLSATPNPFTLSQLRSALESTGTGADLVELVEELQEIGVLEQPTSGAFFFTHELWREHFRAKTLFATRPSLPQILNWIDDSGADNSFAVPFATSLVTDRALQATLFDALLQRSPDQFIRGLQARGGANGLGNQRDLLVDLRDAYVHVTTAWFPGFKAEMPPWNLAREDQTDIAILGAREEAHLYFSLVNRTTSQPDVVVTQEIQAESEAYGGGSFQMVNMELSSLRWDSALLIGTRVAVENAQQLIKDWSPPTEWGLREGLREFVRENFDSLGNEPTAQSASSLLRWAEATNAYWAANESRILQRVQVEPWKDLAFPFPVVESELLAEVCRGLVERGLGAIAVADLGLPGPDQETHGLFSSGYSPRRRQERVHAFWTAATATYRTICEGALAGLLSQLFYSRFPCRPHVLLLDNPGPFEWEYQIWWEPVSTWNEAVPIVERCDNRQAFLAMDAVEARIRTKADSLARTFAPNLGNGRFLFWNDWEAAVTHQVREWLESDLDGIRKQLGRAR